jgi:hypothetical protein
MVLPRTRGIRGRGTRLKKVAVTKLSGGVIGVICALFSIGLTLEGISLTYFGQRSLNLLSMIGIVIGSIAIAGGIKLWHEGRQLQNYRKPKRPVTNRFKIKIKKMAKGKKRKKPKNKNKKGKENGKGKKGTRGKSNRKK